MNKKKKKKKVLIESMDLSKFRKAKIYPNIWVKKDEKQLKAELKKRVSEFESLLRKRIKLPNWSFSKYLLTMLLTSTCAT